MRSVQPPAARSSNHLAILIGLDPHRSVGDRETLFFSVRRFIESRSPGTDPRRSVSRISTGPIQLAAQRLGKVGERAADLAQTGGRRRGGGSSMRRWRGSWRRPATRRVRSAISWSSSIVWPAERVGVRQAPPYGTVTPSRRLVRLANVWSGGAREAAGPA
jgi:hypothetical protein